MLFFNSDIVIKLQILFWNDIFYLLFVYRYKKIESCIFYAQKYNFTATNLFLYYHNYFIVKIKFYCSKFIFYKLGFKNLLSSLEEFPKFFFTLEKKPKIFPSIYILNISNYKSLIGLKSKNLQLSF